ncbi:uncharacterized protein F5147DRAFT_833394 [Suillus discolor]|uniref:Uncharacterized protein n=1 Tax=Suillus discolor TaxID=1912936 RepID=A0A9P7JYW7_9AGAM|nr:uncharacterized protein F5147DRAFT_833394 [Suillus discolor]KAG2117081.1 hypothetical protein F5147DRAFT_833394 [Suillus discolor]
MLTVWDLSWLPFCVFATACLQCAFPISVKHLDEFNDIMLDALPGDYGAEQPPPNAPEQTPDYLAMLTRPNTPPH